MATIMIIGDNSEFRELLKKFVEINTRYSAITASSGKQALNVLKDNYVDIFLIDLEINGMDGVHTIRSIRCQPEYKANPILVLTGTTDKNMKSSALQVGATSVMQKPIDFKIFDEWIAHNLHEYLSSKN